MIARVLGIGVALITRTFGGSPFQQCRFSPDTEAVLFVMMAPDFSVPESVHVVPITILQLPSSRLA